MEFGGSLDTFSNLNNDLPSEQLINNKQSWQQKKILVLVYRPELAQVWNGFIEKSKNATFLHLRDYMDYHKDRFEDHSLLFYQNKQLVALMPANIQGDVLYSHNGLTYGGVLSGYNMTTPVMLSIFAALKNHCMMYGLKKLIYRAIPFIYHSIPSDEDLYALFRYGARLTARSVSSCIYLPQKQRFSRKRIVPIKRAKKAGLIVRRTGDLDTFMQIETDNLLKNYGVKPIHSINEIKLLSEKFPHNIKLFASYMGEKMLAGILVYESGNVAHGQYGASSTEGRLVGAQDIIEDYLINEYFREKKFFDFGISTENCGKYLNEGLINKKESFGASAVMYDIYELTL